MKLIRECDPFTLAKIHMRRISLISLDKNGQESLHKMQNVL